MSSARLRPLGLRTRLALWTSVVLAASLAAGFLWVHDGLRRVLEAHNDAFLERKAAELLAGEAAGGLAALESEIEREVEANEADALVIAVLQRGGGQSASPRDRPAARALLHRAGRGSWGPATLSLGKSGPYRALGRESARKALALEVGISLAGTEATLAEFDRRVAGGGLVFLALAVAGGWLLSRAALRPVAASVATARRLDPEDLSGRLPRTGAGDELDELAGTINGLLDRLAAYHAQVRRITADASHELRSPLGAMRAAIEVVLGRPRTADEYREALATLGEQCERLTGVVNVLLLLARADAGDVGVARDPVGLSALAEDVAEMYEPLADERGIALACACEPDVCVPGDAPRLRQLVTNLLDNAIKFTGPGGTVRLELARRGDSAQLTVDDNGVGIGAAHLPHVFERFYRADEARTAAGSGLGLSICRWIAGAHGGSIAVASEPGRGTTFTVLLPAAGGPPAPTP